VQSVNHGHSQPRVLVAGGGPVGLTMAALLASQGIASTVIEADESYCTGSRAICVSRRSLEILDWCGASDAVVAKGLGWTSGRSHFRADEVLRFEMPHDATQRFAPMTNIQQYYIEQYALEAAERNWPGMVQVLWKSCLKDVAQNGSGVMAMIETDGQAQSLQADWLIACDGGRSTVRDLLGLQLKGIQYEGRYVIVDVKQKSTRLQKHEVERLAWFDPPTNPGSTILMHRQPDDVWRIDYQVRDDEDPAEAVKPENVLPRVKAHLEWMGETLPWEPLWISIYNAKCLTLDEYRHGRIFFAGDAAHLVPIFGVRGLNSGLDDVGNLAWKLASVIRGQAGDALLNTYSTERRAAALINIEYGSKSTEFMSPPHHGFDLLRDAALRLAGNTPEIRSLINPRQSAPVRYPGYDTAYETDVPTYAAKAGMVAPEARVMLGGKPQYLSQCFGHGYTLLCFGDKVHVERVQTILLNATCDPHGEARQRYEADQQTSILVRPDGYIAARWNQPDAAAIANTLAKELCHAAQ
jgi:3-(3-hydroxy-phenyl)propionate hydroxylase